MFYCLFGWCVLLLLFLVFGFLERCTPQHAHCEGPRQSTHVFGMWATGVGGEVRKNTVQEMVASYKNISPIYLHGGFSTSTPNQCTQNQRQNALKVLHLTSHYSLRRLKLGTIHYAYVNYSRRFSLKTILTNHSSAKHTKQGTWCPHS